MTVTRDRRADEQRRDAAPDGGARPPRRRVEQGRGDDGALRGRGRRRPGRHLHRRRARQRAQPEAGPARDRGEHRRDPARPRWTGPARSSASGRRGSASSTPACPRATRCRRCPRAASAWSTRRTAPSRWSRLIREFRPHVVTTYDENGGYPHPDHIMCHNVSVVAFDAAGDPDRYPGRGRAVAAAEALLQHGLHQGADHRAARGACSRPGSSRRTGSGWRSGTSSDDERDRGRPGHHPGAVRRLLPGARRRAAGARHPGRPGRLLVPGADGDPAARSGRPRTSSWPGRSSTRPLPEDDLFAGVRETLGCVEPAARSPDGAPA